MAKKKTGSKKGPAKKSAAKKPAVKKVEAPIEETPVAPPVEEPQASIIPEEVKEDEGPDQEPEPQVAIIKMGAPVEADDWRGRLVVEARELKEKMTKLRTALDQNKVPHDQIAILSKQHSVMKELYIILNTRLSSH